MSSKFSRLRRLFLNEAIVANPDAIDAFLEPYIDSIKFTQGKKWIATKARKHLFNTEALLQQVNKNSIGAWLKNIPPYVHDALNVDAPVYVLNAEMVPHEFTSELGHIVDYLNSIFYASELQPAQWGRGHKNVDREVKLKERALAIIPKLEQTAFKDIKAQSDKWFQFVATNRDLSQKQEGVDIIKDWGQFYAVSYKNKEALELDGDDLANCLRYSYYENSISSGQAKVISIREKSKSGDATRDRAVVAMSFKKNGTKWEINECKGYGNKVPAIQYHQMIANLLNELGIIGMSDDITSMGLTSTVTDGVTKYGTFEDIATLVYDKDGIKILKTNTRVEVGVGKVGLSLRLSKNGNIYEIIGNLDHVGAPNLIKVLNILNLSVSSHLGTDLRYDHDITRNTEGKFVKLDDPAHHIYSGRGIRAYSFDEMVVVYLPDTEQKKLIFEIKNVDSKSIIISSTYDIKAVPVDALIELCNEAKLFLNFPEEVRYSSEFQDYLIENRICSTEDKTGYMDDLLVKIEDDYLVSYSGLIDFVENKHLVLSMLSKVSDPSHYMRTIVTNDHIVDIAISNFNITNGLVNLYNQLGYPPIESARHKLIHFWGIVYDAATKTYGTLKQAHRPIVKTKNLHLFDMGDGTYISAPASNYRQNIVLSTANNNLSLFINSPTSRNALIFTPEICFLLRTILNRHKKLKLAPELQRILKVIKIGRTALLTPQDVIGYIKTHGRQKFHEAVWGIPYADGFKNFTYGTVEQQLELLAALYDINDPLPFKIETTSRMVGGVEFSTSKFSAYSLFVTIFFQSSNSRIDSRARAYVDDMNKKFIKHISTLSNTFIETNGLLSIRKIYDAVEKNNMEVDKALQKVMNSDTIGEDDLYAGYLFMLSDKIK